MKQGTHFFFKKNQTKKSSDFELLWNPQQNKRVEKKRYSFLYSESTEILLKESTYMLEGFKDLSVESRNMQAKNCAPIQCTIWPRNEPNQRTHFKDFTVGLNFSKKPPERFF